MDLFSSPAKQGITSEMICRSPSKFVSVRPESPRHHRVFSPTRAPKYDLTPDGYIHFHKYRKPIVSVSMDIETKELDKEIVEDMDVEDSLKVLATNTIPINLQSVPTDEKKSKKCDQFIAATSWEKLIKSALAARPTVVERMTPRKENERQ